MPKTTAFFKLIRWPNLLMIMLTQVLLNYMVIGHILDLVHVRLPLNNIDFILLMLSTVFMAAFGYAFNDVQDEQVDQINKDHKRIIGHSIPSKLGLKISYVLLALAFIPAIYLAIKLQMVQLIFVHISIAGGLWYYSTQLKKSLLLGNIIISLFTAMSIYIVWLYHLVVLRMDPILLVDVQKLSPLITKIVLFYAAFAFVISMIREIVKDVEDQEGDAQFQMNTFVVKFGLPNTKILIAVLVILMIAMLAQACYLTHGYDWTQLTIYLLVAVGIPLLYFLMNLKKSQNQEDFSNLSILAKVIMAAGILSMQLFYISYGI